MKETNSLLQNANVSTKAANFKGRQFMVVHGTADDNVHFQHTAQLVKALTDADVDFRVQVCPLFFPDQELDSVRK